MILLRSILKSHVSATSYVNEHGTAVNRREHEDSRTSALEGLRSHPDHRVRSYARKMLGSKDSYDLHQIRRDRFGHLPHWNKLDDHTRHAIVDAEEEKAKSHKEFEEWKDKVHGKKKDAEKIDRSGWEQQMMFKSGLWLLRKSHVKATTYVNEHGTVVNRQEHEDSRPRTVIGSKKIKSDATKFSSNLFLNRYVAEHLPEHLQSGVNPAMWIALDLQHDGNDLVPVTLRFKSMMPSRKPFKKAMPTVHPITVGLLPVHTDGAATRAAGLTSKILSLPENKFKKSHNPLHLIRETGC